MNKNTIITSVVTFAILTMLSLATIHHLHHKYGHGYFNRYQVQYYGEQSYIFDSKTGIITHNIVCTKWEKSYSDKFQCSNLALQKVELI